MGDSIREFEEFRQKMNDRIMESGNLEIKRFFALVVGGSIVIPHLRRAAAFLDEIREEAQARG